MVVEASCWERAWIVVADAVGGSGSGSGEGTCRGECRVRVVEASTHEGVHGSCWCPWTPGVRIRRRWNSGAAIVRGARRESTSDERRRVWIDEGSKGGIFRVGCSHRWSPVVGIRCSWESDAVIVSGAGCIGTSVQRRRVRTDEGSKCITVRVGCRSSSSHGVRVGCSLERETSIVSGASREGTSGERRRVRIDEGCKIVVRMACIYRCFRGVRVRCSWESDAVIVSGACGIGTSGERRRVRVDEGSRGEILRIGCCPWVRKGIFSSCSKRLIGIVVTIADMADMIGFGKRRKFFQP